MLRAMLRLLRRAMVRTGFDRFAVGMGLPRFLIPKADEYLQPTIRRVRRRGIRFELDASDYVQWLTFTGEESSQRAVLLGLVKAGDVALDIGTNIGDTLLGLAQKVGPAGQAIGFEANPATLQKCRRNLGLNAFPQARVEGFGLGEVAGSKSFGSAAGGNSGADRFMPGGGGAILVDIAPLDDWFAAQALDRLDFIKIDVEGFEHKVLRGAEQCLAQFRPVLFIELCHTNLSEQGDSAAGLVGWLEARGYRLADALTGAPISADEELAAVFTDAICRPVTD
jgi:FkbM family methyltransferase